MGDRAAGAGPQRNIGQLRRRFAEHERFQSQNVAAGQSLDGWVAFDVPADAVRSGKIQWSPNLIDDGLRGYWLL